MARSSRRNREFIGTLVFGAYFLFVAITHLDSAAERFEESQPFTDGLFAQAKIVDISANQRGGTPVSVRFTDLNRRVQVSNTRVHFPEYLRVGQSVEISYRPDSPEWVRAPELGWSESEYRGWRGMSLVWLIGAISIFPLAVWRRFRQETYKPIPEFSDTDGEFKVKQDYFRLILLWSIYAFGLFVVYAIVSLSITHTLGLPILVQKVALLAWHSLLAFKVGLPAVRILLNDPMTINRQGISFYRRPPVPWADMSQILFMSGRDQDMSQRLVISLTPSSMIKPNLALDIPLRKLSPLVYLNLYGTRWDDQEIAAAINHFGLERQDPNAAHQLMNSLRDSGVISHRKDIEISQTDDDTSSVKEHIYINDGFHFGSR